MEGQAGSEWLRLFTRTSVGITWLALIVLSAAGLLLINRSIWLRGAWALLLLSQEAWSGHAAAVDSRWAAVTLDLIHLAASALWAGGLILLLVLWYGERKEAGRFGSRFSTAALISLAVLTLSGILLTLMLVSNLRYVLMTPWGILLLVKTALVVLVIVTGALIRRAHAQIRVPAGSSAEG